VKPFTESERLRYTTFAMCFCLVLLTVLLGPLVYAGLNATPNGASSTNQTPAATIRPDRPQNDVEQAPRSEEYRKLARFAAEGTYLADLSVSGLLMLFLGFCIIWGILKIFASSLKLVEDSSKRLLRGVRTIYGTAKKWRASRSVFLAMLCILAVLGFAGAQVLRPVTGPSSPSTDMNGAYIATETKYTEVLKDYEKTNQEYVRRISTTAQNGNGDGTTLPDLQQQLANAIWQAPLEILAIVLAIAAFFGWQGYTDLKKKLSVELKKEVSAASDNRVTETLVIALTELASSLWRLSEEVKDDDGNDVNSDGIPPNLSQNGLAHVSMARRLLTDLLRRLNGVSEEVIIGHSSLERAKLEVRQAWAYHTATLADYGRAGRSPSFRAPQISEEDWDNALEYSAEALAKLDKYKGALGLWLDTFLYVRILHARIFVNSTKSKTDAEQAFRRYESWKGAQDVVARFKAEFAKD
jgi:hypothetical protein